MYRNAATFVPDMKAWYVKVFGAKPGMRGSFQAADLPGVNLTYSPSPDAVVGTQGRSLDHIGFEVKNLEAFCKKLESMMFPEPDRYAPARSDADASAPTDTDRFLARTLEDGGVVLAYGLTFDANAERPSGCVLHPIGIAVLEPPGEAGATPFFTATDAVCNLPILANASRASGFMNAAPDGDGILRRVPLIAQLGGDRKSVV